MMEMTYHPKCIEVNGEFFVVYPPEKIEEARQSQANGHETLIEQVDPKSGNILLDSISRFDYRENHK